jgi:nitrate reductase gamma subunit
MAVLLLVHLLGLLIPRGLLAWNEVPVRLYLLEGAAGAAGLAALVGLVVLVKRQVTAPVTAAPAALRDTVVLGLLLVAAGSGLAAAWLYRWGTSWGAVTLTPYLLSLARLDPEVELVARMPFLVKLHVFSSFAFFAAAAYSPLASIPALPACRLWARASHPVRERLARVRRAVEAKARRGWEALQAWREEES